jgi:alkylation response protein AidB-like acyl-CoA dehydrogenase
MIGPGGVELGLAFLTSADFTVVECWDMDGLRATGSHDVLADLDLDADRVASLWTTKWPDAALFRLRTFDVLGPCLSMVPLGIGRAALDVLRAKTVADAAGQPIPGPRPRLADDPVAQLRVGQAELGLRSARSMLFDLVGQALDAGAAGDEPSRATSALIGLACGQAMAAGRVAVQTATELLGSAGVRDGSPLVRLRRDLAAAGAHVMFSHNLQIGLGRELAGLPTSAFPFLPGVAA